MMKLMDYRYIYNIYIGPRDKQVSGGIRDVFKYGGCKGIGVRSLY